MIIIKDRKLADKFIKPVKPAPIPEKKEVEPIIQQNNPVIFDLSNHILELGKMVKVIADDRSRKKEIVATVQRDKNGKMSAIFITEK